MQANEFGRALRDMRLAGGLTQEELAERARLSVRTISLAENGFSRPYLKTVHLLAGALGLTGDKRDEFLRTARPAPVAGEHDGAGHHLAAPRQLLLAQADFT